MFRRLAGEDINGNLNYVDIPRMLESKMSVIQIGNTNELSDNYCTTGKNIHGGIAYAKGHNFKGVWLLNYTRKLKCPCKNAGLKNLTGFLNRSFFSKTCKSGNSNKDKHLCNHPCVLPSVAY
ncbi:hypothetical protein MAR_035997 [Mya arenaria]|uniref:Uncharacterized protein n=1 Tax=Mya arenaria TaxID=6604 RepID=A0ABY7EQ31_MYAAR|nr:hypothetical protein MAR_035997 [Mya arenaria]